MWINLKKRISYQRGKGKNKFGTAAAARGNLILVKYNDNLMLIVDVELGLVGNTRKSGFINQIRDSFLLLLLNLCGNLLVDHRLPVVAQQILQGQWLTGLKIKIVILDDAI